MRCADTVILPSLLMMAVLQDMLEAKKANATAYGRDKAEFLQQVKDLERQVSDLRDTNKELTDGHKASLCLPCSCVHLFYSFTLLLIHL